MKFLWLFQQHAWSQEEFHCTSPSEAAPQTGLFHIDLANLQADSMHPNFLVLPVDAGLEVLEYDQAIGPISIPASTANNPLVAVQRIPQKDPEEEGVEYISMDK